MILDAAILPLPSLISTLFAVKFEAVTDVAAPVIVSCFDVFIPSTVLYNAMPLEDGYALLELSTLELMCSVIDATVAACPVYFVPVRVAATVPSDLYNLRYFVPTSPVTYISFSTCNFLFPGS